MNVEEMKLIFENYECKPYEERKQLKDLDAFILIDKLVPSGNDDIVSCASHDQIWIYVDTEELANVISEDEVRFLSDCGVFFDEESESLSMFA